MERGLAIEEDDIPVNEVTVDNITLAEVDRLGVDVAEGEGVLVLLDVDALCARVGLGTVANIPQESLTIVRRHDFGKGKVHRNLLRHTEFVQVNVGVGGDDRTGAEIHTLAHQIAAHTTGLGTEAGLEGSQGTSRALLARRHATNVVVHVGRNRVLEKGGVLVNHRSRVVLVDAVAHTVIRTDDGDELVGEIVLHALVVVHHDRRTHRKRRHCEDGTNHPLGTRELVIESQAVAVCVRDALKGTKNKLGLEDGRLFCVAIFGVVFGDDAQLERTLQFGNHGEERLAVGAFLGTLAVARHLEDLLEARHSRRAESVHVHVVHNQLGAVQADDRARVLNHVGELVEVHGSCEGNVSKMSGTQLVCLLAGGAHLAVLNHTKPRVKHAVRHGLVALVGLVCGNLHDTPLENVVGVCDAKLDANDCVTHLDYFLFIRVYSSVFRFTLRRVRASPSRTLRSQRRG